MAKVIIGAEVKVDGMDKAGQSVGTLKKQIKDATNELHTMSAAFGETSTQALEAAKKVALLKDRVQDAAETAALFDPGKKPTCNGIDNITENRWVFGTYRCNGFVWRKKFRCREGVIKGSVCNVVSTGP